MKKPNLTGEPEPERVPPAVRALSDKPKTTGRHIVTFRSNAVEEGIKELESVGLKVAVSSASDPEVLKEDEVGDADVIVFPMLGMAVVAGDPDRIQSLANTASDSSSPIKSIKQEKIRYALESASVRSQPFSSNMTEASAAYLRGYRGAIINLVDSLIPPVHSPAVVQDVQAEVAWDESLVTWGIQVTRVDRSKYSGREIGIAILDTGLDLTHPDFKSRSVVSSSFVQGSKTAQDGHGHGTHCVGTACGPLNPSASPRYGVAYNSDIYVGKVLNDSGRGADGWIIAGIEWAIKQGCSIISMSLGSSVDPEDPFDLTYEDVARRALAAGTLIIAAAGNESNRPNEIRPVGGPANCPSIMAVAAVHSQGPDTAFRVAGFSNGGINAGGGEVDIAAPGVSVYSSYRMPTAYARLNGTSMATPHVAGIAALYAEAYSGKRGRELWNVLIHNARLLPFSAKDTGAGLVQGI